MARGGRGEAGTGIDQTLADFLSDGFSALSTGQELLGGEPLSPVDLFDDTISFTQFALGEAWATPIIAGGLDTLLVYSALCGDPVTPDVGAMFAAGATAFQGIENALNSAEPNSDWTGSAATEYALADATQTARAADMARADRTLQNVIADEAQQVAATRDFINDRASNLTEVIPAALAALALAPEGLVAFEAIQIAAVLAFVPLASAKVAELAWNASRNAQIIDRVAAEYSRVADDVVLTGISADPISGDGIGVGRSTSAVGPGAPAGQGPASPAMTDDSTTSVPDGRGASTPMPAAPPAAPVPGGPSPAAASTFAPIGAGGGSMSPVGSPVSPGTAGAAAASPGPVGGGAGLPSVPAVASGGGIPGIGQTGLPGGASGGAGSGIVSSLLGPAAQALGQIGQGTPAAGQPGAAASVPVRAGQPDPGADEPHAVDEAEPGGSASRAPIHVEIDLDPTQLSEPVHLTFDPKNHP